MHQLFTLRHNIRYKKSKIEKIILENRVFNVGGADPSQQRRF